MEIIHEISAYRQWLEQLKLGDGIARKVGLVPTMGYLHEGHLSLIEQAREECELVVVSIFVNPLQFGPQEDFHRYPRDIQRDSSLASKAGVDVIFAPTVEQMYPAAPETKVVVNEMGNVLCGASRPGHFDGVATVVMKLLQIIQPDHVYFGMKDAQQVAVIERMVADFNIPVQVVACETVREPDGLALSSRNIYLTAEERQQATVLYESLQLAKQLVENEAGLTAKQLIEELYSRIRQTEQAAIDYIELRTYPELRPCDGEARLTQLLLKDNLIVACAVKFGSTRLIDNIIFRSAYV